MDILDRQTLIALARPTEWPAISIYLPSIRDPRQSNEARLRFKNLLNDASARLVAEGMRTVDADNFLAPLFAIRDDDSFWRQTADGLAMFLSKDESRVLRLATDMPEQVIVGDRFYLRPLAAAHLRTDNRFYTLALDKGARRLYAGDRGSIEEIEIDAPVSIDDSTKYDEPTKLMHPSPYAASRKHQGKGSPIGGAFPRHGQEIEYAIDQLNEYIKAVEAGVDRAIGRSNDSRPLVMVGPDRVIAEYRKLSRYPITAQTNNKLGANALGMKEAHRLTLELLDDYFEQQAIRELTLVTDNEGTELVTRDAEKIAAAAAIGRVRALFFDEGTGPFGVLDRDSMEAHAVCDAQPPVLRESGRAEAAGSDCGWDLIDLALAETVLHEGEIHVFQGEDAPVHGAVALLRY